MVVAINGVELNYEITGDGEPLLWLHGFMGAGPDWPRSRVRRACVPLVATALASLQGAWSRPS